MEYAENIVDVFLHLDTYLTEIVSRYGTLTYAILFAIVFAETGLIITPFLPGDSLLFGVGTIAALGPLNIVLVIVLLIFAAILGDTVNYTIGFYFGQKIVDNPRIKFINQEHIDKTEQFFRKHGAKTIILARFIPIVRTFAPFVAGVGKMNYRIFFLNNVVGAFVWVLLFTLLGYFFGNIPFIQENFHYAVFGIIGLSLIPVVHEYYQHRKNPDVPGVSQKKLEEIVDQ